MDIDEIANLPNFVAVLIWKEYVVYLWQVRMLTPSLRPQPLKTWLAEQNERGATMRDSVLATHVRNVWTDLEEFGEDSTYNPVAESE